MLIEFLKAVLFGIVEGICEWLPVSSTGHIILLDEFLKLNVDTSLGNKFAEEFIFQERIVTQAPLTTAILITEPIFLTREIDPFGVSEFVAHKV